MSQPPRKAKGESRFAQELDQSHAEDAAEALESVSRQRELEQFFEASARLTPTALHAELLRFLRSHFLDDTPAPSPDNARENAHFLEQVRNQGGPVIYFECV